MKTYTHSSTAGAVTAILNLFSVGRETLEALEAARRDLSAERYQEREAELMQRFRNARSAAYDKVMDASRALKQYAQASKSRDITIGQAEEDFKLLGLPVPLTAEDLALMVERNLDNAMFFRAAQDYAAKHGLDKDPRFGQAASKGLEAAQKRDYDAHADTLSTYLQSYFPAESIVWDKSALESQRGSFQTIEENGLLARLDASI